MTMPTALPSLLVSSTSSSRCCSREELTFLAFYRRVERNWPKDEEAIVADTRLPMYVAHLSKMVDGLETHPQAPSKDLIKEYRAKVGFLQKVVDDAKTTSDAGKKMDANDIPDSVHYRLTDSGPPRRSAAMAQATVPFAGPFRPPPGQSDSDPLAAEIHLRLRGRKNISEREMLLGSNDSDLRRRNVSSFVGDDVGSSSAADFEGLMRAQHEVQEQTAEEMLELARALKEQSLAAHEIIKKDITTLTKTDELADRNTERLGIETERLAEHTKRACRCWIWFIMLVVSITFVAMVMVMKVFRKRNY